MNRLHWFFAPAVLVAALIFGSPGEAKAATVVVRTYTYSPYYTSAYVYRAPRPVYIAPRPVIVRRPRIVVPGPLLPPAPVIYGPVIGW